ncbi:MAG: hypothetical protein ACKV1O_16385 [Saprospiraceae bacterium]
MKSQLQQLIASGKTEKAIKELLQLTSRLGDKDLHQEVILQSARYEQYAKEKRIGSTPLAEQRDTLEGVNEALIQIIEQLPEKRLTGFLHSPAKRRWLVGLIGFLGIILVILVYNERISPVDLASNSVTILIHGPGGKAEKVLPNRGKVTLIYGDAIVSKQINNEGEATFLQISDAFFHPDARVEILFEDPLGEPYRTAKKDSLYQLIRGKYIALEAKLFGLDKIFGIVKNKETGEAIEGARVVIQGEEAFSNQYGEYTLYIPEDKQQQFQTIRVSKKGYKPHEMPEIPLQTKREVPIFMTPDN